MFRQSINFMQRYQNVWLAGKLYHSNFWNEIFARPSFLPHWISSTRPLAPTTPSQLNHSVLPALIFKVKLCGKHISQGLEMEAWMTAEAVVSRKEVLKRKLGNQRLIWDPWGLQFLHLIRTGEDEKVVFQLGFPLVQWRKQWTHHSCCCTGKHEELHRTVASCRYEGKEDITRVKKFGVSPISSCLTIRKAFYKLPKSSCNQALNTKKRAKDV